MDEFSKKYLNSIYDEILENVSIYKTLLSLFPERSLSATERMEYACYNEFLEKLYDLKNMMEVYLKLYG